MLKIYVANLDDSPDAARGLYVEDSKHGWKLDCDIDEIVHGLKTALKSERTARRELQRTLARLTTKDGRSVLTAIGQRDSVLKLVKK